MKGEHLKVATEAIERMANRLRRHARRRGVEVWDLKQSGMLAAIVAYESYDEAQSQWITHLYQPVRFAMLRQLLKLGTVVNVPRDGYKTGANLNSAEFIDELSPGLDGLQDSALECRELLDQMTALIGEDGARVMALVLIGSLSLREAADILEMRPADLRSVRAMVLHEMKR